MALKKYTILSVTFLAMIQILGCNENTQEPSTTFFAEYSQIDFEPAWSNDGNKIVYVHSNPDFEVTGIYVIDTNGDNNRQIVSGYAKSPGWSPDGNWIVFAQGDHIYKIKISRDSITQLTFEGKNQYPKWSEDGSWISYSNIDCSGLQCGIWIMRPNGDEKRLIDHNGNYPNWAIGSSSLIYFKPFKNLNNEFNSDSLMHYFINTNTKVLITVLSGNDHSINSYPNYSQDKIVLNSTSTTGFSYIYSLNPVSLVLTKLTNTQGWSPAFSRNKQNIIYTNRNLGNGRLWTMKSDGSNPKQLTF